MPVLIKYLPWLLSCITCYQSFLVGNRDNRGWILAMCNQALWSIWVVGSATWGFVPLNIALWIIYIRNYRKWRLS